MIGKILVIGAALAIGAVPSQAQRNTHVLAAASAAIPAGHFADRTTTAPGFLAGIIFGPNNSPVGGRLDVSHYQFPGRSTDSVDYSKLSTTVITADAVVTLTTGYTKPYLVAGVGWYTHRFSDADKSDHSWGLNGGVGLAFPFILGGAFLEARYHEVNSKGLGQRYIPITFGLMF